MVQTVTELQSHWNICSTISGSGVVASVRVQPFKVSPAACCTPTKRRAWSQSFKVLLWVIKTFGLRDHTGCFWAKHVTTLHRFFMAWRHYLAASLRGQDSEKNICPPPRCLVWLEYWKLPKKHATRERERERERERDRQTDRQTEGQT